ncbi:RES domain-containing protein [Rhodococcus hoagii]|nr:RES domain-containing protein [Prescottella equi]
MGVPDMAVHRWRRRAPALVEVWRILRAAADPWTAAMWLCTPQDGLDGRSAAEWLTGGGPIDPRPGRRPRRRAAVGCMTREVIASGSPENRSLTGFPTWSLTTRRQLWRGHKAGNGPWWFASSGRGRFDLVEPRGTCYVAFDERTAIRETVARCSRPPQSSPASSPTRRVLSRLRIPPAGPWPTPAKRVSDTSSTI